MDEVQTTRVEAIHELLSRLKVYHYDLQLALMCGVLAAMENKMGK